MKKSTQVAVGGLATSLCVLCMFLTGLIPFSSFVMPAIAGFILISVVVENGFRTAVLVYIAVSILGFFVVPDRQSALLFTLFLGYYPLVKFKLDKIQPHIWQYVIKLVLFNISIVIYYYLTIYVLGIPDMMNDFGVFGKYAFDVLIIMVNVTFVLYDHALVNIVTTYVNWFRPRILKKCR